jgi:hypothetical protein
MPPQTPSYGPPPQSNAPSVQSLQPDYSFLNEKHRRRLKLPISTGSMKGRIVIVAAGFILLIILYLIIKALLANPVINNSDYLVVTERQQEMIHILTVDITSSNVGILTPAEQNFVATASLTLGNAQTNTLNFMAKNGDKVNQSSLSNVYSTAVDSDLQNSINTNTLQVEFQTVMQTQLNNYLTNLNAAYSSTKVASGKSLLQSEYKTGQLLIKSLNSQTS